MIERGGKVRAKRHSKKDNKKLNFKSLRDIVMGSVDMFSSTLMTDDFKRYKPPSRALLLITQSITVAMNKGIY